ncbi:hypothetical protein R3P38DRAFT_2845312 [Favolaschia claudopus]|uniref:Uncharacterized protein n=1 Tax=Favolaschia claudopus TaxID=2862362 RepID=A0AAW0DTL6_9AGAR
MQDVRRLHVYKNDVLNPLNRQLDLSAGPSSTQIDAWTVCNDPETTLLSWATYGELFHHTLELAYLPFPQHKPLSTIIRYKWFVYCMPDINSFTAFNFTQDETPQFSGETDMCHQLSMQCANRDFFRVSFRKALKTSASCQATSDEKIRRLFVDCAMHMGLRSLELLIPGGVEKLSEDLERIMRGIHRRRIENDELGGDSVAEKQLLKIIGDPWLLSTHITLELDLPFTFGGAGYYGLDDEEYDEVLEAEVIAAVHEPVRRPIADEAV